MLSMSMLSRPVDKLATITSDVDSCVEDEVSDEDDDDADAGGGFGDGECGIN